MRLSKKLLATLLPITATSMLVPVLTSCNKGNSYTISYGDEVNCLDEQGTNYHSFDDVKNAVKNHTAIESITKITQAQLAEFQWSLDPVKQFMYYDLIASTAILNSSKLHLTWNLAATEGKKINLIYADKDGNRHTTGADELAYEAVGTQINITLVSATEMYSIKSYNFQNTTIGE